MRKLFIRFFLFTLLLLFFLTLMIFHYPCKTDTPQVPIYAGSNLIREAYVLNSQRAIIKAISYAVEQTGMCWKGIDSEFTECGGTASPYGVYRVHFTPDPQGVTRYMITISWDTGCNPQFEQSVEL